MGMLLLILLKKDCTQKSVNEDKRSAIDGRACARLVYSYWQCVCRSTSSTMSQRRTKHWSLVCTANPAVTAADAIRHGASSSKPPETSRGSIHHCARQVVSQSSFLQRLATFGLSILGNLSPASESLSFSRTFPLQVNRKRCRPARHLY